MDNKRIVRRMGVGLALSLLTLGLLGARPAAQANTTLTVNSTLDAVDANPGDGVCATAAGACTLRAAVQEANALVGMDTIIVPAGTYDLSILGSGEDATATGDLDILDDLTITGDGANLVTLDGSRLVDRVLHVLGSTEVTLSGVTVAGGTADTGGGIYTIGSLTLVNTHLIANFSTDAEITGGGAIYNEGDLLLQRSTISGNSAADRGGGIYTNGSSATVTLVNSTITGNTASYGGGIASFGREVTTFSSTISHNSATNFGGGIYLDVKTSNTIWADNTANRDGPNCSGFLDSSGYNLVSNNSGCSIESTTGDQIGTAAHPIDPLLGALQNNGGQTPTQALLPGSPAIEAGDAAGCLDSEGFLLGIDQRNYDRRADGDGDGWRVCDIGAYEFGAASEPDFSLVAAPAAEDICKAGTANFSIGLQSYAGFANPVTLSVSGQPAGSTVTFSINPITPPGSSTLTVNAPDPTPGMYPMIVDGTSFGSLLGGYVTTQTITHTTSITLNVYSDAPGTVTLTTPADGATGVPLRPAFAWQANQEASAYDLEIALDEDFTNVVYRATTSTPNHTSATMLTPATTYYWRVRPQNACGDGSFSTVYSFTTLTPATQFLVNSTVDVVDAAPGDGLCATAGGVCTLRAAVQETNALPGANTISLPRGTYQLTIRGSDEDEAATGDLDIRDRLKLVGPNSTRTMIRGMNSDRILQVHGQQTVSVVGLTITGGAAENGAGIYNEGTLTLNRSSLTANGAADRGGGLYNVAGAASATIRNSTIADNSAGHGGGVFHFGTTLTIDGSTISGNTASVQGATLYLGGGAVTVENSTFTGNGGGIENFGELTVSHSTFSGNVGAISNSGVLTVSYSTIADNTATGISNDGYGVAYINYSTISNNTGTGGGGIYNGSTLYVNNSTISGNEAVGSWGGGGGGINTDAGVVIITNSTIVDNTTDTFGGGIYASGFKYNPLVSLHHTILANNSASWGPDCWPAIGSLGYNIIGDTQDCLFGAQYGDQTNVDPRIGPLRDNGGPTLTHALQANSPAVDAGDPAGCADPYGNLLTDDQRGFLRPVDGDGNGSALCDTGAYERGSTAPPDFTLAATPAVAEVCAPANTLYDVQLNAIGGYADPVTLSASGYPAGATAAFDPIIVTPPGSSLLTIGNTGAAAPGRYWIEVTGMGPTTIHTATVGLNLYDSLPSQTQLLSPPDGASGVSRRPVLLWSAAGQVGASYHLEIASDLGFTNLVYTATLNSTGGQPTTDLEPRTVYYWRVQAENACGVGSVSSIFRFTTAPTDFTLAAYPANQSICAPADAVYDVTLSGLSDPVTLDVAGYPPGATAAFDPNPVNTPGSSELTISNTGAATPGVYALQITGITPTATHTTTVQLSLATALPGSPTLLWPPDEGLNQPLRPTFTWSAADQAEIYTIEIATDVAFTDIVDVATVSAVTTYQPTGYLHSGTTYYWRVRSVNSCGSSDSAVFRLTTGNGTFMVNSPADAVDANPGDNLCATAAGFCTLRAAIQEANAAPASQEEMIIILPSGVYTLTLAGANEDSAAFGDLDISGYYAIVHEGVEASEVFGNGAVTGDRVFHVLASAEVTLVGLTIRGGVAENGAGIYNSGWLLVTESTLSDNDATGAVPAGGGGAYNNGTLLLNNVLLASNSSSGYGGGVYTYGGELSSDGVLTITNSVIEGNVAQDGGGVTIATDLAAVTIQATTIEGNAAVGNGGGLALRSGAVHVTDSAVHGNAATYGGGIQQNGNELHVTNSTISGNSATESGGGLEHAGTCCTFDRSLVWLNNVTMTENSALNNGGFYNSWGTTYLENTLVAGNSAASSPDCRNPYTFTLLSNDYNLLGNDEGCPMTSAEHDQIGTPDDPIDPLLGPLQGNGGPTLTHALLAGSPAIEAGNPAGCPDTQGNFLITDQRGYPRPEDGDGDGEAICDVGAYEASGPDFALLANPSSQGICLPGSATYTISALSIAGYHEPVSLTTSSLPAEATATFAPNPVIAGEESLLTIEAFLNATAGDYDVPVVGTVPDRTRTTTVTLGLYDALPTAPLLLAPADGSTEQPPLITFEWAASNQAGSYSLEIARDSAFLDIVESATGLLTTYYTISAPLDTHTLYYWRVRAQNSCGLGDYSAAFSFTTGDVWNRTFVVNSLADGVDVFLGDQVCAAAGGICTLRAAIQEANALNDDEPVLILLPAGDLTLTIAGEEEDSAATGDLDVTANVSIVGLGADSTIIHGNGAVTGDRVFHILASVQATISSVAIVDGVSAVNGGGVYNSGVLTITGSTLQTNVATFNGGGVYSDGTLVMADSALWGNTALGNSGGALFLPSGEANTTIINSTISGNTAAYGGGIFHELGNLTLIYSTVTNNQSTSEGGGIYYRQLGSLVLQGTILAGNIATTGADCRTISRNMSSAGYNIVGSLHGCIFTAGEGDQLGTYFDPLDPLLGPLQNNGGPTLTHALLESSPAIDMGDPIDCLATDQRGVARPQGFRCDVGAYELESTAAPVCSAPGLAIPDHDPAGVTDDLVLTGTSSVVDLNVQLVVTHPFVGDLIFTLTHVDTGTAVTLMDRPGFPPPPPCNGDNIDATLDDEGTGAVEDACSATPPTISGFLIPSEPLSAFDGEATAGTWRLTAVDNGLGSLGTLDSWCVEVTEE